MNLFVVVGGPPASGKSTVAAAIAPKLRLPLLAKDVIKDALFDALGEPDDLASSRRLGRAAVHAVLALAHEQRGAVLDSTWYPYAIELARGLPAPVVEVRCVVPKDVARERYVRRMPSRRDGHLQEQRTPDELWDPMLRRPTGLGPVITVDTTSTVDIAALCRRIRSHDIRRDP